MSKVDVILGISTGFVVGTLFGLVAAHAGGPVSPPNFSSPPGTSSPPSGGGFGFGGGSGFEESPGSHAPCCVQLQPLFQFPPKDEEPWTPDIEQPTPVPLPAGLAGILSAFGLMGLWGAYSNRRNR